jgi:hypothetical protein
MNAEWIVVGLAIMGVLASIVGWAQTRGRPADLGAVSHNWLAEHRLSQTQDSQR